MAVLPREGHKSMMLVKIVSRKIVLSLPAVVKGRLLFLTAQKPPKIKKNRGKKKKTKKYCIGVTAMDPAPNPIEPRGNCRNYKQELPARRRGGKIK